MTGGTTLFRGASETVDRGEQANWFHTKLRQDPDPDGLGVLYRRSDGKRATFAANRGYNQVIVDGLRLGTSYVVWMMWYAEAPPKNVGRKNGIRGDDRPANLYDRSRQNVKPDDGGHCVLLELPSGPRFIGWYATPEEAAAAKAHALGLDLV